MKSLNIIISGLLLLSGCQSWKYSDDPAHYTKDKALARAEAELQKFADEYGVPVSDFKGPYFDTVKAIEYPAYIVCYKNPPHYFCYDDWTGRRNAGSIEEGDMRPGGRFDWLRKQE